LQGVLSEKELIQPQIYTPRRPVISTDRPVVSTEAADAKRVFGGKIGTTSFQAPTTERLSYVPSSDTKRMVFQIFNCVCLEMHSDICSKTSKFAMVLKVCLM